MYIKSYIYGNCIPHPNGTARFACVVQVPASTVKVISLPRVYAASAGSQSKVDIDKQGNAQISWAGMIGTGKGMTNNVATYEALFSALIRLQKLALRIYPNVLFTESLMVVNQVSGVYTIKRGFYIPYHEKAIAMFNQFPNATLMLTSKESNIARSYLTNSS